jgi:hypothetical protein
MQSNCNAHYEDDNGGPGQDGNTLRGGHFPLRGGEQQPCQYQEGPVHCGRKNVSSLLEAKCTYLHTVNYEIWYTYFICSNLQYVNFTGVAAKINWFSKRNSGD